MRYWPFWPKIKSYKNLFSLLCVVLILTASGCLSVKTTKSTATLLKAYDRLSANVLVEKINSLTEVNSIKGNASLKLTDLRLSQQGKIEPYRPADALIVLQRPEQIRLLIRVPILKQNIADMTSNGEKFRIAVYYPNEYRRFLTGSNSRSYTDQVDKMTGQDEKKIQQRQQITSISRIRPQHITEAVLIKPIALDNKDLQYFTSDLTREEIESIPGQSPKRVLRSYQVLYLLEKLDGGQLRLLKEFWFDRTQTNLPLAHMQIFNQDGAVVSEVSYKNYKNVGKAAFPQSIEVIRSMDNYTLELNFENTQENTEIEKSVFFLENKENLPEKDLDAS